MRKFYLYLITFALSMTVSNIGAQSKAGARTKAREAMFLKYPGSPETEKNKQSHPSSHQGKHVAEPAMKINEDKELWGYLVYDTTEEYEMGMGTFAVNNAGVFNTVWPSERNISAGACVNDVMYLQEFNAPKPKSFFTIDLLTGEEKKIADYEDSDPILRDMTYDYTTNTMYAVGGTASAEYSSLYSVDLRTGDLTELFPLDYDLITLAADNQGNIYGVEVNGGFCQVFVEDQYVDMTGFTNEFPMYLQSMDIDQSNNTLYWAGFTEEGESFLATVDLETGEATRLATPLGENAEIQALYVPSKIQNPDAPDTVEGLEAVAGEQGALAVTLSWTNPSQTAVGDPLTELTKVDIYRNEEWIHTVESPVPGEPVQWTDTTIPGNGFVEYKLIPSNEAGEGKAAKSAQLFVGKDLPGEAGNPVMTKEEGSYRTRVGWTAPLSGMNGGWWDTDALTYDVVRRPDNRTIAENLTETSCTDETITELNAYSYEIIPKTPDGEGIGVRTNKLFVGPSLELPYFCNFSTEEARNMWVVEDANNDGCTWMFGHNYKGTTDWFLEYNLYNYEVTPIIQANEWFFSAPFKLTAGRKYMLAFRVRLGGALAQEKFRTVVCSDAKSDAQVTVIGDYTTLNDQNFQPVTAVFEVAETGDYHIGFQCYSDPDQWMVQITDISLEESFSKDMESIAIKGITAPVQNETTAYEVTVKNNGFENISSYQVQVVDENLNVLGSNRITARELAPQESLIVEVKCVLPDTGAKKLSGRVVLDGDQSAANDLSFALEVEVLPEEEFTWKHIGSKARMQYTPTYPFMMEYRYSGSQTLYLPSDLQFASGKIERLAYYYYIQPVFGRPAENVSIRISLANTEVASLLDEYIPADRFTEVYRGTLSVDSLNNVLMIDLDTPFQYTGGNLCILTERTGEEEKFYRGNYFLYTTDEDGIGDGRTRFYGSEDVPFGPGVAGITRNEFPNVSLLVNKDESSAGDTEVTSGPAVYPNPVTERLYIRGKYVSAKLYSVNGGFICEAGPSGSIETGGLERGIYFLHVNTGNNTWVRKIVRE